MKRTLPPRRKLRAKDLHIRRTPDNIRQRPYQPRTHGKTTNLGLMEFIAGLFELNEILQDHKKMTDAEIRRQILQEFPNNRTAAYLKPNNKTRTLTVNYWRCFYNRGQLSPGIDKPKMPSRRYDEHGNVVNSRTGKPLT